MPQLSVNERIFYVLIFLISGINVSLFTSCRTGEGSFNHFDIEIINGSSTDIIYANLGGIKKGQSMILNRVARASPTGKCSIDQLNILEPLQGGYTQLWIEQNDRKLCFSEYEGPSYICNYQFETVGKNEFKYTYTFTDEVLLEFDPCVFN